MEKVSKASSQEILISQQGERERRRGREERQERRRREVIEEKSLKWYIDRVSVTFLLVQ